MSVQLKANNQDIYANRKKSKYIAYYDDGDKSTTFIRDSGVLIKDLNRGDILSIEDFDYIYLGIDNAGYLYLLANTEIERYKPKQNDRPIIENGNFIHSGTKSLFTS